MLRIILRTFYFYSEDKELEQLWSSLNETRKQLELLSASRYFHQKIKNITEKVCIEKICKENFCCKIQPITTVYQFCQEGSRHFEEGGYSANDTDFNKTETIPKTGNPPNAWLGIHHCLLYPKSTLEVRYLAISLRDVP